MIDKFSIHNGVKYSSLGIFQNYFVLIPAIKHIKYFHCTTQIYSWKSNGFSEESIENITKSDSNFAPTFIDHHSLLDININGHCLKKNIYFFSKKVKNLNISYTLIPQLKPFNTDFTLSNCLFGSIKLTKNADLNKYKYTGYGIRLDSHVKLSLPEGSIGKILIIFGVDLSSVEHIDNKGNNVLVLGKGPTQGLDGTTFAAAALYPINLPESGKRFVFDDSAFTA